MGDVSPTPNETRVMPPSLRGRLDVLRAAQAAVPAQQQAGTDEGALLPFAMVENFLTAHPIFVHQPRKKAANEGGDDRTFSARALHASIVEYHKRFFLPSSASSSATTTPPSTAVSSSSLSTVDELQQVAFADAEEARLAPARHSGAERCPGCGAKDDVTTDFARGEAACNRCGAVVRAQLNFRSDPHYSDDVDLSTFRRKRGRATNLLSEVPQWMVAKCSASSEPKDRNRHVREELQQWNQYVNLDPCQLRETEARVRAWKNDSFASSLRVAAALIHTQLKDRFPDERMVRSAVRRAQGVSSITHSAPVGGFRCGGCGADCNTRREASMHCGTLKAQEGKYGALRRRGYGSSPWS